MNSFNFILTMSNFNKPIFREDISSFDIISDINSSYLVSNLVIVNRDEEYFNLIYSGMLITYDLILEDSKISIPMRVFSFDKIPRETPDQSDLLNIKLIHTFYFDNHLLTKSYFGSTAEIILSVLNTEKINYIKHNIFPTDERPATRYRLQETIPVFLERICKYARKNETPTFLYMDPTNTLNLKSIYDFKNQTEGTFALAKTLVDNRDVPKDLLSYNILEMADYHIFSNLENCYSKKTSLLATTNFVSDEPIISLFNTYNNELTNEQTNTLTSVKTEYMSWEYLPSDAYSFSLRKSFEENREAFTAIILFDDFLIKEACPGYLFRLILPGTPVESVLSNKKINLGEGGYFVNKSILTYDSSSGNPFSTKLYLTAAD